MVAQLRRPRRVAALGLAVGVVAAACGGSDSDARTMVVTDAAAEPSVAPDPTAAMDRPVPAQVYDPVRAGEPLPDGYRQLLARDAIMPVYEPTFVPAGLVGWGDDNLVIGVDLEGEARAYPVGFLTRREMVIDNHRGIPTLVTW